MSTYSQIYIQVVMAVKGRPSLISQKWEEELYKYITGIITNKGQKLIVINGMPDHIHILIGMKPSVAFLIWCGKLKSPPTHLSRKRNLQSLNLNGRKATGLFLILILI